MRKSKFAEEIEEMEVVIVTKKDFLKGFKDAILLDSKGEFEFFYDGGIEFRIFEKNEQIWRSDDFFLDESLNNWEEVSGNRIDKSSVRRKIQDLGLKQLNEFIRKLRKVNIGDDKMVGSKFAEEVSKLQEEGVLALELINEHIIGHLPRFSDEAQMRLLMAWKEAGILKGPEDIIEASIPLDGLFEEMR